MIAPITVMLHKNNNTDDHLLLKRAQTGERMALEQLLERHRRRVVSIAYRALSNADDAQDVAQEALVYVSQKLTTLRNPEAFAGWLRQITLNLCTDYRRRRGTRRIGEPIVLLNEASEEANYAERLIIQQALAPLSEAHRTVLLLHYIGGWSIEEVAEITSVPINTVRSRLMHAKKHLRTDLSLFAPKNKIKTMNSTESTTFTLTKAQSALLYTTFPNAKIQSIQENPEPWMPFSCRITGQETSGNTFSVDIRNDITPDRQELLATLSTLGIPVPKVLATTPEGGTLCRTPQGENTLTWALGGTPHRIRIACERGIEGIEMLQSITEPLLATPVGQKLPRRSLQDEADQVISTGGVWLADPWFAGASQKVRRAVGDVDTPLVFTDYLHFFPNFLRIATQETLANNDAPMGWPGDTALKQNPITEFVHPFGHVGDPILGLTMVLIYDCYPIVHAGFVEQFLWKNGYTKRDFGIRLALRALQTIQRELSVQRPEDKENGADYWDALHGYAEQGLGWM
jgi:RNA polymerase sigma-70 factor, ECF subfamily